ncbi:hypothetical protein Lal_00014737 [Lupinus albus]|nr:hypothetical protein Lal_00014737 [Lupinus albus]
MRRNTRTRRKTCRALHCRSAMPAVLFVQLRFSDDIAPARDACRTARLGYPPSRTVSVAPEPRTARIDHDYRLPQENPHRARLRRGRRNPAGIRPQPVEAHRQQDLPEARGHAERLQLQAARRLQQDGEPVGVATETGRDLRIGRQPRAGRRHVGGPPELPRRDRDADHHAQRESGCRARVRRQQRGSRPARRVVHGRVQPRAGAGEGAEARIRAPVRRPGRHRRPGHDRRRDPAPAFGADPRDLPRHRRRWPDQRRGRVREADPPGHQDHRRADDRFRRDGAQPEGRRARDADGRRPVRGRHRRAPRRRGDVPPVPGTGRRHHHRRQRRAVRRHQGRVHGHAQHRRAVRRARHRGREGVRGALADVEEPGARRDPRRRRVRRQHELRPPALRRRARRTGRGARSRVRRDDPRAARQLQALLRADRPAQRHRVQLPHQRRARGARVRRRADRQPQRVGHRRAHVRGTRLQDARPHARRTGETARAPPRRRQERPRARRTAVPLRIPGTPGRADALPGYAGAELEHLAVPLPEPGRRRGPHPRRPAGAVGRDGRVPRVPRDARLSPLGRERESGLQAVPVTPVGTGCPR